MKQIKSDGTHISYNVYGDGEVALLFVHGAFINQTYWKEQVDFFKRDYKVITLDLPGHGKSGKERKDWSIKNFAADIIALITELELRNVILIGHSMGADVNLIVANNNPAPVLGIIGIDILKNAGMPLPDEYQQQVSQILHGLETDFVNTNEQYARMALLTEKTPKEIVERIVSDYRNAYQPMAKPLTKEVFSSFEIERKCLQELQYKLYLINVSYMPTNEAPLQRFAGRSGYEVLNMKSTSHFPMLESPIVLNALLQEVIQEIAVNVLHGA
ncbi:MAG: alpha/beta hydrolase [Chitinophagaceae bacterium]